MKLIVNSVFAMLLVATVAFAAKTKEQYDQAMKGKKGNPVSENYLQIPFKTIDGKETNLEAYKGKVILLVNVASKCGFTPQYKGLEEIYEKYKDKGFVVLGFPANNFGGQEPGSDSEIYNFCTTNYSVTFPMMSKVSVLGDDIHPLFAYLTEKSRITGPIQWNFSKFLIDREGRLTYRFPSKVTPSDPDLVAEVEKLLK